MTTLVIGARGAVGRNVLEQLVAAGEPVRASVRDLASADFPAQVPVVAADLTKPETLESALDGVRNVFLYAPSGSLDGFIEAASGVEHVVLLSSGSVLLDYATENAIAVEHRAAEEELSASGLRWTPIRPLVLASNALNWAHSIRADGVVELVYPEAVTAPIHERDIAAVAVAALTGDAGPVSDLLTGGESLSQRRQVEVLGRELGKEIRIEELSETQALARFGEFGDPATAAAIVELIAAAAQGGSPATDTAHKVLGRPPVPFSQWVRDHREDFR
jgi:uncharacterized protein YbjT (DUF2867 family)